MSVRSLAMVAAVLALGGCATGYAYDDYSSPAYQYGYDQPSYGGYYGYGGPVYQPYYYDYGGGGGGYDRDDHRYFRPDRGVTCDRARNICYDRYGKSYHDTARYLGERDANRAYKHYGNDVFLYSPRKGVVCDRRTNDCTGGSWNRNGDDGRSAPPSWRKNNNRFTNNQDQMRPRQRDLRQADNGLRDVPSNQRRYLENPSRRSGADDKDRPDLCPPTGCNN